MTCRHDLTPASPRDHDLGVWAYQRGVTGKPTDNAFIEAFNERFREECLNAHWFLSIADAQVEDHCDTGEAAGFETAQWSYLQKGIGFPDHRGSAREAPEDALLGEARLRDSESRNRYVTADDFNLRLGMGKSIGRLN